jgi:hypothetical protein
MPAEDIVATGVPSISEIGLTRDPVGRTVLNSHARWFAMDPDGTVCDTRDGEITKSVRLPAYVLVEREGKSCRSAKPLPAAMC